MEQVREPSAQARALARIQALSRVIVALVTVALVLAVMIPLAQVVVILLFADHVGSLHGFLSFNSWGVALRVGADTTLPAGTTQIPLNLLSFEQRCVAAALAALCTTCGVYALLQLRGLFVLYARGLVFSPNNILRIKRFGIWLVLASIAANISGRLFVLTTHTAVEGTANAAMAVVLGAMIYVIAHVMELGREADLERKDFI
jgi:Protein of unknown function (DUF2975)